MFFWFCQKGEGSGKAYYYGESFFQALQIRCAFKIREQFWIGSRNENEDNSETEEVSGQEENIQTLDFPMDNEAEPLIEQDA